METKAVLFVQARMSSTRLPGKMLLRDIGDQPLILHVMDRASMVRNLQAPPILLTSQETDNIPLAHVVSSMGYKVIAPKVPENDVLSRFVVGAQMSGSDYLPKFLRNVVLENSPIIRITGDCPFIDPKLIDIGIDTFINEGAQYLSLNQYWPDGLDFEIFTMEALRQADKHTRGYDREHVTPYIWKNKDKFKMLKLNSPFDLSGERWCVDDGRDMQFSRILYINTVCRNPYFGWRDLWATSQDLQLNLLFPNREKRNQGYLTQAGINGKWEDIRF